MKITVCLLLFAACLAACSKDNEPVDWKGTYVDEATRKDSIIFSDLIFHNDFSYKPYRWQDSALSATYFFYCKSYFKADSIAIQSLLSSSSYYVMVYFRPKPGNNAFVIDSFHDFANRYRKRVFVRIR